MFNRQRVVAVTFPGSTPGDLGQDIVSIHPSLEEAQDGLSRAEEMYLATIVQPELVHADTITLEQYPGFALVISAQDEPGQMTTAIAIGDRVRPIGQRGLSIPLMTAKELSFSLNSLSLLDTREPSCGSSDLTAAFLMDLCAELGEPLSPDYRQAIEAFVEQSVSLRHQTIRLHDYWLQLLQVPRLDEAATLPEISSSQAYFVALDSNGAPLSLHATRDRAEREITRTEREILPGLTYLPRSVQAVVAMRVSTYPEVAVAIRQTEQQYKAHFVESDGHVRGSSSSTRWATPEQAVLELILTLTESTSWLLSENERMVSYLDVPLKILSAYGTTVPQTAIEIVETWKQSAKNLIGIRMMARHALRQHEADIKDNAG